MTETTQVEVEADWRHFIRRHYIVFAAFAAAVVLAVAGAVYVFWWFTGNAQTIDLVPSTLSQWTMNNLVLFILHAVFWELVLVGIPVAIAAVIGWQWWKRLPPEEKKEHMFGKRSKSRNAGGAISPLLFVAFAIKVYVDGYWNIAFSDPSIWTVNYVVGSMITILMWIAAIFAVPAIVGVVWWVTREDKKS